MLCVSVFFNVYPLPSLVVSFFAFIWTHNG